MLKFLYDGRIGEFFAPTKGRKDELEKAIEKGDLAKCLDLIQSQRFDVASHTNEGSGSTYLHFASHYGHREVVQMLLDAGKSLHFSFCINHLPNTPF